MSSSPGPRFAHDRYDDSDPEEADITEHLHPDYYDFGPPPRQDRDHPHTDPNVDPVITRFIDMVNGFNPSAAGTTAFHHHHRHDPHAHHTDPTHDHEDRGNPHHDADTHDHGDEDERHDHGPDLDHPNIHASPFSRNPFFSTQNVHRTTFRGGPFGGTASITIFSGPVRPRDGPPAEGGPPADPFSEYVPLSR